MADLLGLLGGEAEEGGDFQLHLRNYSIDGMCIQDAETDKKVTIFGEMSSHITLDSVI